MGTHLVGRVAAVRLCGAAVLCGAAAGARGQCQDMKLLPPDPQSNGALGSSLAVSGHLAILGAWGDESAFTFRFDPGAGRWVQEYTLVASDTKGYDRFGWSVAVDGDVAVVGAFTDGENGPESGSAYVFRFDPGGNGWREEAELLPEDGSYADHFGVAVALSGTQAIVGAYDGGDQQSGSAYVFRYDPEKRSWGQSAKLLPSNGGPYHGFGWSVAMSRDLALIGALVPSAAYVYRYDAQSKIWQEEAILELPCSGGCVTYGVSVALSGEVAIVGADRYPDYSTEQGAAWIFRREGSSWAQEAMLLASDLKPFDGFGLTVGISGDLALIGTELGRAAYLYQRDASTGQWGNETKLEASDGLGFDGFGQAVAMSGSVALVGAPNDGWYHGSAYVFDAADQAGRDCNGNGACDALDITQGTSADCNGNGVPDDCDLGGGFSEDCNGDGTPAECDADCNANGLPDECDIAAGTSDDCNADGIPDECDVVYSLDGGVAQTALGYPSNTLDVIWLNQFQVQPENQTIIALGIAWYSYAMPPGVPTHLLLYDDPNDDGDPSDAVLLASAATESADTEEDEFVVVPVKPTFVGAPGDSFFVAASLTNMPGQFPMAIDLRSPPRGRSWMQVTLPGQANLEDLSQNPYPPTPMHESNYPGNWMLRAFSSIGGVTCDCLADLTGDCVVDGDDFSALLDAWGGCPAPPEPCPADFEGDGFVGIVDFLFLLAHWG